MSTKNHNGEGSKPYCPEGDGSKNEHRPKPQVNEAEDSDQDLTKTISDFKMKGVKPDSLEGQRLGPVIGNFKESVIGKNPPVPNKEALCSREDVPMYEHGAKLNVNLTRLETDSLRRYIRHFKSDGINSDSSREQMLNAVQQHFASQPPLNEQQVIPKFIDAARDPSKNKHSPQLKGNKVKLEAEDSDNDLRNTMTDFKMKGVKPDSLRGQRVGPLTANTQESVNKNNPQVPTKEVGSRGDVAMYEHGAQLNENLAILQTDSLRRYLRHFKIEGINSDSSREQMLNAVQQHFASQPPLNEQQVITELIDAARRLKNKDKKPKD